MSKFIKILFLTLLLCGGGFRLEATAKDPAAQASVDKFLRFFKEEVEQYKANKNFSKKTTELFPSIPELFKAIYDENKLLETSDIDTLKYMYKLKLHQNLIDLNPGWKFDLRAFPTTGRKEHKLIEIDYESLDYLDSDDELFVLNAAGYIPEHPVLVSIKNFVIRNTDMSYDKITRNKEYEQKGILFVKKY